jgi:hypothetical protein
MSADQKNPLWPLIQDDARPSWAPDILRMGYAIVWKREDLIPLLIKLGVRNPEKARAEKGGIQYRKGKQRLFYFDDVWVASVEPRFRPMYLPPMEEKKPKEWWASATTRTPPPASSWLAVGGVTVADGTQRLADVVARLLKTPTGYPRTMPGVEMDPVLTEVANMTTAPAQAGGADLSNNQSSSPQMSKGIERFK